jgi:hypothetical protein
VLFDVVLDLEVPESAWTYHDFVVDRAIAIPTDTYPVQTLLDDSVLSELSASVWYPGRE